MFQSEQTEKNKEIYRRYIQELFNEGGLDKVECLVSDTYILRDAPPGTPTGTEAIKQSVSMIRSAFPDLKITLEDLIGEGDMVAARSTMRGTHQGTIIGIAATGKVVNMASLTMVRIVDGRLCESWVKSDMMGLMKQLQSE